MDAYEVHRAAMLSSLRPVTSIYVRLNTSTSIQQHWHFASSHTHSDQMSTWKVKRIRQRGWRRSNTQTHRRGISDDVRALSKAPGGGLYCRHRVQRQTETRQCACRTSIIVQCEWLSADNVYVTYTVLRATVLRSPRCRRRCCRSMLHVLDLSSNFSLSQ